MRDSTRCVSRAEMPSLLDIEDIQESVTQQPGAISGAGRGDSSTVYGSGGNCVTSFLIRIKFRCYLPSGVSSYVAMMMPVGVASHFIRFRATWWLVLPKILLPFPRTIGQIIN